MLPAAAFSVVCAMALLSIIATRASAVCVGNCNGDDRVSIAEVQACVNLAANPVLPAPPCPAAGAVNDCIQSFLDSATCPMVLTPSTPVGTSTQTPQATATHTPAGTNTPTVPPTPTFTPAPVTLDCPLDTTPGASQLVLYVNLLTGISLPIAITGELEIGVTAPAADGRGQATCDVKSIAPISITGIGTVCISPFAGCPTGKIECNGGPPLGVAADADGNVASCENNAACATTCADFCGGAEHVLSSGCTGFCTGGDQSSCASDAACMTPPKGGSCNGPDNGNIPNICQCSCFRTDAHGPSDPGDLLCNLGTSINVENDAPCGDGDVKIAIGDTCIPVSTQAASGMIVDANFQPGLTVPTAPMVNDEVGNSLSCSALLAPGASASGLVSVGAVNFFGSALGDLSVSLKAACM